MTAVVVPTRSLTPQLAKPLLSWLIAIGLLTVAAVEEVHLDRQAKNLYPAMPLKSLVHA